MPDHIQFAILALVALAAVCVLCAPKSFFVPGAATFVRICAGAALGVAAIGTVCVVASWAKPTRTYASERSRILAGASANPTKEQAIEVTEALKRLDAEFGR